MNNRSMTGRGTVPRADLKDIVAKLRSLGTFPGTDERDLRSIAESGQLVRVPAGWSLIWERTPADKAYVVVSGELDVRRDDRVVGRLGAGDILGELAILRRRLRSATVVAATPLEVLHFTRDAVETLHETVPGFRAAMDAAAAEHTC